MTTKMSNKAKDLLMLDFIFTLRKLRLISEEDAFRRQASIMQTASLDSIFQEEISDWMALMGIPDG